MTNLLHCGARTIDLSAPVVMGVLNVTPDSFSDGGKFTALDAALVQARRMADEGAAIIDVGGESTRPGADPVSEQQELDRVIPVIERLAADVDAVISVDTSTARVMREAARAGAGLINDVRALTRDGALAAAAASGLPVCLMHMQGEPGTMQDAPHYDDVAGDVLAYLLERVAVAESAGITRDRLLLDPGFGFGKTDAHNLVLLKSLRRFAGTGMPVLAGLSRKSLLGRLLGREVDERLVGSVVLALMAAQNGAKIVRVHDVRDTVDALTLWQAVSAAEG